MTRPKLHIGCKVQDCNNIHYGLGYCRKHHLQIWRNGKISFRNQGSPNDFVIEGNICKIGCYDAKSEFVDFIIIDLDDIEKCKLYKWCINSDGYPINGNSGLRLHTLVSGLKAPDHKNRNTLDNRKENLRPATASQQTCNSSLRIGNSSGYKGVTWHKQRNKWLAQIQHDNKHYNLGLFNVKEEAALAYNKAALELFGEFANLNFNI